MTMTGGVIFDPYAPAVQVDPYPFYRQLRAESPVHFVPAHELWVLTRYDDVRRASGDERLTSRYGNAQLDTFPPDSLPPHARSMASLDPPDHSHLRRIMQSVFSQKQLAAWQPTIAAATGRVVADLRRRDEQHGDADAVRDLARPLPAEVMIDLLHLPPGDRDLIIDLSLRTMAILPGLFKVGTDVATRAGVAATELADYIAAIVTERESNPIEGDVITDVLRARDGRTGLPMTHDEAAGHVFMLVVAALETTEGSIGNMAAELVERPGLAARLRADPALIPAMVDESLRYEPTAQGVFRTALTDVEYGGVTIPEGSRIQLVWASANRDEAYYSDGEEFRTDRAHAPQVTFGHGPHYCLGAFLARAEMAAILECLLAGTDEVVARGPAEWNLAAMPVVRKHVTVPVTLA